MKDYSEYFKNPEAFITNISVSSGKIKVKYKGSNEKIEQELNIEELKKLINRLDSQYLEAFKNKDLIFKRNAKLRILFAVLTIILAPFSIVIGSNTIMGLITLIGSIISFSILVITNISTKKAEKKLDYVNYIINNQELITETLNKCLTLDEKLTPNIKNEISQMKSLQEKGSINVVNAKFADDLNNKDLKRIIERSKIEEGLIEPVRISKEVIQSKTKRRVLKPSKNNYKE